MQVGGFVGPAIPGQEARRAEYGRNLGLAFQFVENELDLTAPEEVLGKPVASDLREGKVTMAVIHALERCTPAERKLGETVLRERAFISVRHEQILAMLQRYGSGGVAMARAPENSEAPPKSI